MNATLPMTSTPPARKGFPGLRCPLCGTADDVQSLDLDDLTGKRLSLSTLTFFGVWDMKMKSKLFKVAAANYEMPPSDQKAMQRLLAALQDASDAADNWFAGHGAACRCVLCNDLRGVMWALTNGKDFLEAECPYSLLRGA